MPSSRKFFHDSLFITHTHTPDRLHISQPPSHHNPTPDSIIARSHIQPYADHQGTEHPRAESSARCSRCIAIPRAVHAARISPRNTRFDFTVYTYVRTWTTTILVHSPGKRDRSLNTPENRAARPGMAGAAAPHCLLYNARDNRGDCDVRARDCAPFCIGPCGRGCIWVCEPADYFCESRRGNEVFFASGVCMSVYVYTGKCDRLIAASGSGRPSFGRRVIQIGWKMHRSIGIRAVLYRCESF